MTQTNGDSTRRLAVFSASDGHLIGAYENGGPLALDAAGDRLFVDRGAAGLAVLQASTGKLQHVFVVPGTAAEYGDNAAPQYDQATRQVLAFRGSTLYAIDSETGQVARTVEFDLRPQDNCRQPHDVALPITRSFFDPIHRFLYLDFVTYSCIPWIGLTNVSYDLARGAEVARQGSSPYSGLAAGGRFYALSWFRFGVGTIWTERNGYPRQESTGWSSGSAFQFDARRGALYQSADGNLRVFDADDLHLRAVVPLPVGGELAAFDEATDQLYFVADGVVRGWSAGKLQAPATTFVHPIAPPGESVRLIVPSPGWTQDDTLFGVWAPPWPETACYVFNQTGGPLLRSTDGGKNWQSGWGGLPDLCGQISALALSPAFAEDRIMLAGVKGHGIFRSGDAGERWQPSGSGLPHMGVRDIAFSPGFSADHTVFAVVFENGLQRSLDGGVSWQSLNTPPAALLALSPEFDRDGILAVYANKEPAGVIEFSQDRGDHWGNALGGPGIGGLRLLSLAPAFARWHTMFAMDMAGDLYRSADGGQSWTLVLKTGSAEAERSQIVYGPDEEQRAVFLLVTGTRYQGEDRMPWGELFRSTDGGQRWATLQVGEGTASTALAISPGFARDGLILLGTVDGRVLGLRDTELRERKRE